MEDQDRIKELIEGRQQSLRSDYVRTLEIWTSCFPASQMHICFYDDVVQDPQAFMRDILSFLNVDDSVVARMRVDQRVHGSRPKQMPPEIERYLAEKYHPEIQKLTEMVGGHTHAWLKQAEEILNGAPPAGSSDACEQE